MHNNIYLYRNHIIDIRIPITIFYKALVDIKIIQHPVIFCDSYALNVSKIDIPIMPSINLYNIAYKNPIFFVDSTKDIDCVNNIVGNSQFILFNDQKLEINTNHKNKIHNLQVLEDTKLHDVIDFLQEIGL